MRLETATSLAEVPERIAADLGVGVVGDGGGRRERVEVFLPSRAFCTDNAAMIARAGRERLDRNERSGLDLVARAHWPLYGS